MISQNDPALNSGAPAPLDSPTTLDVHRYTCLQSDDSKLLVATSGSDLYGEVQLEPGRESSMLLKTGFVPGPMCGLGPASLAPGSSAPTGEPLTLGPNEILVFRYDWTMPGLTCSGQVMWSDFSGGTAEFKVRNVLTNSNREIDRSVGLDILERLVVMADLGNRPIPGGDLYAPALMWLLISGGAWAWSSLEAPAIPTPAEEVGS